MHSTIFHCLLLVSLGFGFSGRAEAGITALTNADGFSTNTTELTFAGVQVFQDVTSYDGVGFKTLGTTSVTGIQGAYDPSPSRQFGPQEGTILNQFQFGTQGIQITLPTPENILGFDLLTYPNTGGDLSISLFSGSTSVGSITLPNQGTSDYLFYGFYSNVAFDRFVLVGPGDGRFSLDNLELINAVPEPGTLALFGIGLGVVGILGHRGRTRVINDR